MKTYPQSHRIIITLLAIIVTLYGCSGNREDVRITYCKKLTTTLIDSDRGLDWGNVEQEIHSPEYAVIKLSFTDKGTAHGLAKSACWYEYAVHEENVMTHSDPLSAYATVPYQMTLNEKPLSDNELQKVSSLLRKKQFKAIAKKIEDGYTGAQQKVGDLINTENEKK